MAYIRTDAELDAQFCAEPFWRSLTGIPEALEEWRECGELSAPRAVAVAERAPS